MLQPYKDTRAMPMCALYTSEKTNEETVFVTHDKGTSTVKELLV